MALSFEKKRDLLNRDRGCYLYLGRDLFRCIIHNGDYVRPVCVMEIRWCHCLEIVKRSIKKKWALVINCSINLCKKSIICAYPFRRRLSNQLDKGTFWPEHFYRALNTLILPTIYSLYNRTVLCKPQLSGCLVVPLPHLHSAIPFWNISLDRCRDTRKRLCFASRIKSSSVASYPQRRASVRRNVTTIQQWATPTFDVKTPNPDK